MDWDDKLAIAGWSLFLLMWVPLGVLMWAGLQDGPEDESFELLLFGVFMGMMLLSVALLMLSYLGPVASGWWWGTKIRKNGILVPAKVIRVADTGWYMNNQPVFEIVLRVSPPDAEAFETPIRDVVPLSAIPQIQPGARFNVWYLPGTTRIAFQE